MAGIIPAAGSGSSGGRFRRRRYTPIADINVTPLVVSVNSKGEVFLGETPYDVADLATKLKAVHEEKPDQRVFMRGDKSVDYGKMMEVMGVVIDSGFRQLGLLGEQAQQLGKGGGGTVTPVPAPQQQPAPRR